MSALFETLEEYHALPNHARFALRAALGGGDVSKYRRYYLEYTLGFLESLETLLVEHGPGLLEEVEAAHDRILEALG